MNMSLINSLRLNDFRPSFKCGAAVVGGALAGGGALLSGLFGAAASSDAVSTNVEENAKNRTFNRQEAEKARGWQTQERVASQDWQQSEYDRRAESQYQYWLKQNQYNSPVEQAKRLSSVGLNPSGLLGASQVGLQDSSHIAPAVSPPSAPGTSPASVSTSNPVSANAAPTYFAEMVNGIGSIVKSFAGASKDSAEAKQTNELLQFKIKEFMLNNQSKELQNAYDEMRNFFTQKTLDKKIQKVGVDLDKLNADVWLTKLQGDYIDEQTVTERFKQILSGYDIDLRNSQSKMALIELSNYEDKLKAQIRMWNASAKESLASAYEHTEAARLHVAQADFTKMETDLSSLKKVAQTLENGIKANEFSSSTLGLELQDASQMFKMIQEADKLEDIKDNWNLWNYVRKVKNLLGFQMSVGVHN